MRQLLLISFILLAQTPLWASDFNFISFYSSDGFFTEKLLSFRIESKTNTPFSIRKVTTQKPCYSMVDIHREHLVHIYCSEAIDTSFTISIDSEGRVFNIRSPLFTVNKVALISSNPKPDDDTTGKSKGRISFENRCIKCHQSSNPIAKGVTRDTLTNAFGELPMRNGKTTDKMSNFKNFFNTTELDELVLFINEEM